MLTPTTTDGIIYLKNVITYIIMGFRQVVHLEKNQVDENIKQKPMNVIKKKAIKKAMKLHGPISPCSGRQKLSDCFTVEVNGLYLWFNCEDNSTRVVRSYHNRTKQTQYEHR